MDDKSSTSGVDTTPPSGRDYTLMGIRDIFTKDSFVVKNSLQDMKKNEFTDENRQTILWCILNLRGGRSREILRVLREMSDSWRRYWAADGKVHDEIRSFISSRTIYSEQYMLSMQSFQALGSISGDSKHIENSYRY